MTSPISLCMIVRNEARTLEDCLKSLRPYVKEICIVDTGSTDGTPEIAKRYADKFVTNTDFNDPNTGELRSFCDARNFSFSLATQPWVLWADGDDIIQGGENLQRLIDSYSGAVESGRAICFHFEYEYSHDEHGNPVCIQERERLISPPSAFRWSQDVHEVLVPTRDVEYIRHHRKDLVYVHQKYKVGKVVKADRNLSILKAMYERDGESDARLLYYLANEYGNNNDYASAVTHFTRYVELSGWDDERYMACLWLNEFYRVNGNFEKAIDWAFKAISLKEDWGEAYFRLAKAYYFLAQAGKDPWKNFNRCVKYARQGLAFPPTDTPLFVNPTERNHEVHIYLNVALNYIGDTEGALESCKTALRTKPDDKMFLFNKKLYEKHLASIALVKYGFSPDVSQNSHLEQDITSNPKEIEPSSLLGCVRTLWKNLLLHDEVLSARRLLDAVPWQVRDHADVEMMKRATDPMLEHMGDSSKYEQIYLNYEAKAESIPLPNPVLDEYTQKPRYDAVMTAIREKLALHPVRYLDIGCYDGWLTNRAGLIGAEAYGLDFSVSAVDLANKKSAEFNTGACHFQGKFDSGILSLNLPKFDIISMLEVYEHCDNMDEMLPLVMSLLAPGGKFILSTPDGSWLRGKNVSYHEAWNCPKPREHVRAPTRGDLRKDFEKHGFERIYVCSYPTSQSAQREVIDGQATLVAVGERPYLALNQSSGLNISIYVGYHNENWDPSTIASRGIGGSETAVVEMAKRLQKLGHSVTVYNQCDGTNSFEGVVYKNHEDFGPHDCDVLITSRRPSAVDFGVRAKSTICWVHDIHCGEELTHERALKIDRFFCLTHWHKQFFLNQYPFVHPSQVIVTRNGIDLTRFDDTSLPRNPHRAIYSSSPDRGLQVALQVWPRIRQAVPDAELHVYYGFDNWEACVQNNPDQLAYIQRLRDRLKELEPQGVIYHGRTDQTTLARDFLSSGVWMYPTWFSETSCQLAGTLVSTSNGMKPIEDINVGDLVLTHKGRFRRVTELIKKDYEGPLYSIKRRKDFRPICLTAEHPLWVHRDGEFKWLTPGEIRPETDSLFTPRMNFGSRDSIFLSDYVDMPVKDGMICKRHGHPVHKSVPDEVKLTEDVMFILGLFAADGHAGWNAKRNAPGAITFALHRHSKSELIERTRKFFDGTVTQTSENGVCVTAYCAPWSTFLRNVIGVGRSKRIPSFVWECPESLQRAFHDGMFAGDGSTSITPRGNGRVTNPFKSYTSVSPSLAYGCAQLLSNLGFHPGVSYSKDRDAYTLNWSDRRVGWYKEVDGGFSTEVEDVRCEHYSGVVYNFEVDEDRSYVTDRTAVHNCITAMEALASGLAVVTSPLAALPETLGSHGVFVNGDWTSDEYQNEFVQRIVQSMLSTPESYRKSARGYATRSFNWDGVARDWDNILRKTVAEVESNVVLPYQSAR